MSYMVLSENRWGDAWIRSWRYFLCTACAQIPKINEKTNPIKTISIPTIPIRQRRMRLPPG